MTNKAGLLLVALALVATTSISAAAQTAEPQPIISGTAKAVALDPTTFAPAIVLYKSMMLDWQSSQALFAHGFVEDNARYTVNGLAHDVPVSYAIGKQRILRDALGVIPAMAANNAASQLIERTLTRKHPDHRTAFHVLGIVQRVSLSALISYRLSVSHFEQWQLNQRMARQLGY